MVSLILLSGCAAKDTKNENKVTTKNEISNEVVSNNNSNKNSDVKEVSMTDDKGDEIELNVNKGVSLKYDLLNLEKEISYVATKDTLNIHIISNSGVMTINVLEDGEEIKSIVNISDKDMVNLDVDLKDIVESKIDINSLDEDDKKDLDEALELNTKDGEENSKINVNSKDKGKDRSYIIKTTKGKTYDISIVAAEHSGSLEIFEK